VNKHQENHAEESMAEGMRKLDSIGADLDAMFSPLSSRKVEEEASMEHHDSARLAELQAAQNQEKEMIDEITEWLEPSPRIEPIAPPEMVVEEMLNLGR